jgi:acid phosphatase type 7
MPRIIPMLCLVTTLFSVLAQAQEPAPRNTLVAPAQHAYLAGAAPDRIILTITEDPATSQSVNWRTAPGVATSEAQITRAIAGAGLHLDARTVTGASRVLPSDNGLAQHHQVVFDDLEPDTLYAYRVRGHGTWSEWFQFRTARQGDDGFAFLYFGDAQNSVKSHFSRVIREARLELPRPAVMLHAGDLVNLRAGNHDDEWGEWFDAGAFLYAMTPNVVVAGNHEHVTEVNEDGTETRVLSHHFRHQFSVPANGLPALADTVYATRYQNTLFVVLDSTAALEDEALAIAQAGWLDALLAGNTSRWIIVSHHHPIHSVSLGRDNPLLREHWQPVYERHRVDLVLQGHDHTYGRGPNVAEGTTLIDGEIGTVYVVSVAGPKMYRVAEDRAVHRRVGEDVQLYQIIHVGADRLAYEARTVAGEVYDAFDLVKHAGAPNRLVERAVAAGAEAVCGNPEPPRETRCWEGTELVY